MPKETLGRSFDINKFVGIIVAEDFIIDAFNEENPLDLLNGLLAQTKNPQEATEFGNYILVTYCGNETLVREMGIDLAVDPRVAVKKVTTGINVNGPDVIQALSNKLTSFLSLSPEKQAEQLEKFEINQARQIAAAEKKLAQLIK